MLNASNHLKVIDFGTDFFFKTEFMDSDLLEKISKIRQHEKEEDVIDEYQSKHKATFVGTAAEFIFNFFFKHLKTFGYL